MKKNHEIRILVTKEYKELLINYVKHEGHPSLADFIREVIHQRIYNTNRFDRFFRILDENERDKNTSMANKV